MKLHEIVSIVEGRLLFTEGVDLDTEIACGAASDLMSDVLAFAESGSVLLTGLVNPQAVRTAEMADILAIVFVRGKQPPEETVEMARERGLPLATTDHPLFEVCGRLYKAGLRGCDIFCRIA